MPLAITHLSPPRSARSDFLRTWAQAVPGEDRWAVRSSLEITSQIDEQQVFHLQTSLSLPRMGRLTQLPGRGFIVRGDIDISRASALPTLPEILHTGGVLRLTGCSQLQRLPPDLRVGDAVYLEHCRALTTLPDSLLSRAADGRPRRIFLEGSGVGRAEQARIAQMASPEEVTLFVSVQEAEAPQDGGRDWPPGGDFVDPRLTDRVKSCLSSAQYALLQKFLSKVRRTSEAKEAACVKVLAERTQQLLTALCTSDVRLRETLMEHVTDALEHCRDRTLWVLGRIEILLQVQAALRGPAIESQLLQLATRLIMLEEVHQVAAKACVRRTVRDDIETYLAFEVNLKRVLDLPVSSQTMFYEQTAYEGPHAVTPADYAEARTRAEQAAQSPQRLHDFLHTWEPWQRLQRQKEIAGLRLKSRPCTPAQKAALLKTVCPFTQQTGSAIADPVIVHASKRTAYLASLPALLTWYESSARDPFGMGALSLADVQRFV